LVLGIIVMVSAINNPNGSLAYWFSLIPFTSPIVMMVRIPFEVPIQDVIISAGLLIITFIFMVWLAAKIYRTGILMYGKKVNYRELWKWIRYKN
ncbi:MAG: ABC transporter permease, partial [Bacteroidales bacterium]|nr:ABC transporter permease [Bacteroidales bacterium]